MLDDLQQRTRDYPTSRERDNSRRRGRNQETPIQIASDRENFNHSVKSMGMSEISHAFNMHFNAKGEQDATSQSILSHRSPSLNHRGGHVHFPEPSDSYREEASASNQVQTFNSKNTLEGEVRFQNSSNSPTQKPVRQTFKRQKIQAKQGKVGGRNERANNTINYEASANTRRAQ